MIELGSWLASEEHAPRDLTHYARRAEEVGFPFALTSDHYHPWIDAQGQASFVWGVIGGIAEATSRLRLGTGVTCPTIRIHPAIVGQAAATAAAMMPARCYLGIGTGEHLNEHLLDDHWPPPVGLEMLEEAVAGIRQLWEGGYQRHHGKHYTVENARICTLPEELPPILMAASGPHSTEAAGRLADGLIGVAPAVELVERFRAASGKDKPRHGQLRVCWSADEAEARRMALEYWPIASLSGALSRAAPASIFEQVAELVREEDVAGRVVSGANPETHVAAIQEFADARFDDLAAHQISPNQAGFFQFYEREILPRFH